MIPMKNRPNKLSPRRVEEMDAIHRANGFKIIPGRIDEKPQTMPANFGKLPGPKRAKHPLAPV